MIACRYRAQGQAVDLAAVDAPRDLEADGAEATDANAMDAALRTHCGVRPSSRERAGMSCRRTRSMARVMEPFRLTLGGSRHARATARNQAVHPAHREELKLRHCTPQPERCDLPARVQGSLGGPTSHATCLNHFVSRLPVPAASGQDANRMIPMRGIQASDDTRGRLTMRGWPTYGQSSPVQASHHSDGTRRSDRARSLGFPDSPARNVSRREGSADSADLCFVEFSILTMRYPPG